MELTAENLLNQGDRGEAAPFLISWVLKKIKKVYGEVSFISADGSVGTVNESEDGMDQKRDANNLRCINEFLTVPTRTKLVVCLGLDGKVECHTLNVPNLLKLKSMLYFLKPNTDTELNAQNISNSIQFGVLHGGTMESLLNLMNGVYLPTFLSNDTWPDSVRKEFSAQLHKFMSSLTETANQAKGHTVLYIPNENIENPEQSANDKDLVQRLESTLIHWTRQIKEVVSNQETSHHVDNSGPLEEIEFWRSRTLDLSGIRSQLNRPGVQSIVNVLKMANSSYLLPFENLSDMIETGSAEAKDNLSFLSKLQEPCERLAQASPKDIPVILPDILSVIRMIWTISYYYSSDERLTGLLRKVSNQIIFQCSSKIDLNEVFDGDVKAIMIELKYSIECGAAWHKVYEQTVRAIQRNSTTSRCWDFDPSTHGIFAQIDAFVQRCHNLNEVCEGQLQFARKGGKYTQEHSRADLPAFGGTRGSEIEKSLFEIEDAFEKHIDVLRKLDYNILNVKATNWHYDYNNFKSGLKDLEVMMSNVITSAWDGVSTVAAGVELLEAFHHLAIRPTMKQTVEKKTVELYARFGAELKRVKTEFDNHKKDPPVPPGRPKYAGRALWARMLLTRIEKDHELLENAYYLPKVGEATDVEFQYQQLYKTLEAHIGQCHSGWVESMNQATAETSDLSERLRSKLIKRAIAIDEKTGKRGDVMNRSQQGYLESDFDKYLLRLFSEVRYWEKFHGDHPIPYIAHEMYQQQDQLRVTREAVMLVVRDYNTIIDALSAEERGLFKEHLRQVDSKIRPGLNKLTWADKHIKDWFVRMARQKCQDVYQIVLAFKENNQRINENCHRIANCLLVDIEKNTIYDDVVFEQRQLMHQERVRKELEACYKDILSTVKTSFQFFADHPRGIQMQWRKYVKKVDDKIERALRSTAKKSLQELSRAINGDVKSKSDPHPLFKVNMVLDDQKNAVEFRPSVNDLSKMIKQISRDSMTTIQVIPRLSDVLADNTQVQQNKGEVKFAEDADKGHDSETDEKTNTSVVTQEDAVKAKKVQSFYDIIKTDKDIINILVSIFTGTQAVALGLAKIIEFYEKLYQHIWQSDKGAFIRRYANAKRPLSTFDVDIQRYRHHQADVQHEDSSHTVIFIRVDCTQLKQSLVNHCIQWQLKLTTLLHEIATTELNSLNNLFSENTIKLRKVPETLADLKESVELWDKRNEEAPKIETRFEPIEDTYRCLDRFDVNYSDEEKEVLDNLRVAFAQYQNTLQISHKMIEEKKDFMKKELDSNLKSFTTLVQDTRNEFKERGPFHAPGPDEGDPEEHIENALHFIKEFRKRIHDNRLKADNMKMGIELFKFPQPDFKEMDDTETELTVLEKVWLMMKSWFEQWNIWKGRVFSELKVKEMEDEAIEFQNRLNKMSRPVKQWKVWISIFSIIQRFRNTMPLVAALRSPAMRPRHWTELQQEMQHSFDPTSVEFTLDKLIKMGVHMHADAIMTLSLNAQRQLNIENTLGDIAKTWASQELDIVSYKSNRYHKLRQVDEVNDILEAHQLLLSTMKNSPYYNTFSKDINYWSRTLDEMVETIEMIVSVQRQWIYLENIFIESVDIRKQLPKESTLFETVNNQWIEAMGKLAETKIAMGVLGDGLLDRLTRMNTTLENINHSLDDYLEKKRQLFPRFYFLANDDLLQILGHSRDPKVVQRHIAKLFAGIHRLVLIDPKRSGNKIYEIIGVTGADGEEVKFASSVHIEGEVENWLRLVDENVSQSLQKYLWHATQQVHKASHKRGSLDVWIKSTLGQLLITSSQIGWTTKCETALQDAVKAKKLVKKLKKEWQLYIQKLSKYISGDLASRERSKLNALITIEVHARDVIDRLKLASKTKVNKNSFEWSSQLRFYWNRDGDFGGKCVIRQTKTSHEYGYEYQGNSGRLVITPLTDRCYLTLTTALHFCRGGNPQGPAGTGKTETVKDLGKNLAKFVVVFNCSPKMDVISLGRNFSGLAQTGAWGCFDEFNRILIEVLSVVALQVSSILNAIKRGVDSFQLLSREIKLVPTVGMFITMNPGYAGRTELPDNLTSLFRPIAMMVPDTQIIVEMILLSEGYKECAALSKKVVTIYRLMAQQLSKQSHYCFDLRAIKAVMARAGTLHREKNSELSEEHMIMRALRDMNLSKLISEDVFLFENLVSDLFLNMELPAFEYATLGPAIKTELHLAGLQENEYLIQKITQLRECMLTRHGNMLVGNTLTGKSTAWNILSRALTRCWKESNSEQKEEKTFCPVEISVLNPKSLTVDELYGSYNRATQLWIPGVLSDMMSKICNDNEKDEDDLASSNTSQFKDSDQWLVLDGPVDTLWIESMNTVLDDSKVLTLTNGDRIFLTPKVNLLFEVGDLKVASPATVSRCGMVFFDESSIGYEPFVQSWIQAKLDMIDNLRKDSSDNDVKDKKTIVQQNNNEKTAWTKDAVESVPKFFTKYVTPVFKYKSENKKELQELFPVSDLTAVQALCRLFDSLIIPENGLESSDIDYLKVVEMLFAFSVIWTLGASFDEEGRKRFDVFFRDLEAQFPPLQTCYEYFVDPHKKDWALWSDRVNKAWRPPHNVPFHRLLVPTIDTVRYSYLLSSLMKNKNMCLVTGTTGTGKSAIINNIVRGIDSNNALSCTIHFSAASTAAFTQEIIESRLEKRQKKNYGPLGARARLIVFIDDLNMPSRDEFGSQSPIELLRQWHEYGFFFDVHGLFKKNIQDMQLIAAMGPPGGARAEISERFQSRFNMINMTFPSDSQVKRIFRNLINDHFTLFDEAVKPLVQIMTQATLEIFKQVTDEFLPTPSKCHYLFNMRDISKVFHGVLRSDPRSIDTRETMIRLWTHEMLRVFYDRLASNDDRDKFIDMINTKLHSSFDTSWKKLFKNNTPVFGDFLDDDGPVVITAAVDDEKQASYQELTLKMDKVKSFMEEKLVSFNENPENIQADLVLFDQAIYHIARIYRIIKQKRGSALLIGLGGSGRQSLTRLAAHIAGYELKQIEPTKNYRIQDFHEDLKEIYKMTGLQNKTTVFLFTDNQVVHEQFMEEINQMLNSGEIPKLFPPDELQPILDELRDELIATTRNVDSENKEETQGHDDVYRFFIERVRSNLHIVLCMSPIGAEFRNRVRMYPAIVGNTTMDWFEKWPEVALREVASRFLADLNIGDSRIVVTLADVFTSTHAEVEQTSDRMFEASKIRNYVTPAKYLDLVKNYASVLTNKREELQGKSSKLKSGLQKFDESKEQVKNMTIDLEEKKRIVQQKKIQCDKLVVEIIQKQRAADEQRKQVEIEAQRTEEETKVCQRIQQEAKSELEKVTPALDKAVKALSRLTKQSITEVKSYKQPSKAVEKVMSAVMCVMGKENSWLVAKKELSDPNFLKRLEEFDKDNISNQTLKQIGKYTRQKDFNVDDITKISLAAGALCDWVCAMELYAKVYRDVEPRRQALRKAEAKLQAKKEELAASQQQLNEVVEKVTLLEQQLKASEADKNNYQREAVELETKLDRAASLVEGLSGERTRWENSISIFENDIKHLVGDCAIAAAFLTYAGPFPITYRQHLMKRWISGVRKFNVKYTTDFNIATLLANPTDVMEWSINGLPSDDFSIENGILVESGSRWPLMIDPQGQANRWIKAKEEDLRVIDFQTPNFLRSVETALQVGQPLLIQDIMETLDPSLEPVLRIQPDGKTKTVIVGDRELHVDSKFKLMFTTKLANPHYKPEISIQTTIVNFAVVEKGLQNQLLSIVVKFEEPKLEIEKENLIRMIASGKRKIEDLENHILTLLHNSTGNLIDDVELIGTLQESKTASEEVKENLVVAQQTEKKTDEARQLYWPAAVRASLCFFVLNDLATIDPMYQFSLQSYMELFTLSISESKDEKSHDHIDLITRITTLNAYHTEAVYQYACRGLFERHKLLFAFQLCVEKLKSEGSIDPDEYQFFLRGSDVLDRSMRPPKPNEWMTEDSWDHITTLDKLPEFKNLAHSFETNGLEWKQWYLSDDPPPEKLQPPGEWQNKRDEFQQLLILRCLRMDRVVFAARSFIREGLGDKFVESPEFKLSSIYKSSTPASPLIFILSPGVDPTQNIQKFATTMNQPLRVCALGQGQAPIAKQLIENGARNGDWVFLANCHLSVFWLPTLAKIVEDLSVSKNKPHENFRLWLSSDPCKDFPISLLQQGIKMTTEPPRGIRANMMRTYANITEEQFSRCSKPQKFSKLLFGLSFFHAIVVERKKFLNLGWNVQYSFNQSDFDVCENILALYLEDYEETPWEALKYLIAQANYGGRVTDSIDRNLLVTYINQYFCESAITQSKYPLCSLENVYYIPDDGDVESYRKFISKLPKADDDPADAFGQHSNADVASQQKDGKSLLDTLVQMQPRAVDVGGKSSDQVVMETILQLSEQIPEEMDLAAYSRKFDVDKSASPLTIVLLQEIARYNFLLSTIHSSLDALQKGIKGLVVISPELEAMFASLFVRAVPQNWGFAYPSLKGLGEWTRELLARVGQLKKWAEDGQPPKVFWLGGFTFPVGFLTALLQQSARKNGVSIDHLSWDFIIMSSNESSITLAPRDGAYVKDLYLEGARWDIDNQTLAEPFPMELNCMMPIIHFKPVLHSKKSSKGLHKTPLYMYPVRAGTMDRPSFMMEVDLKCGARDSAFWVKRGAALLLSVE